MPDPFAFEPFAPATTAYARGANLIGQTNAAAQGWAQAGPNGTQPTIQSDNRSYPGLAGPTGNSVRFGGNGASARLNLGKNVSAGTWYFR